MIRMIAFGLGVGFGHVFAGLGFCRSTWFQRSDMSWTRYSPILCPHRRLALLSPAFLLVEFDAFFVGAVIASVVAGAAGFAVIAPVVAAGAGADAAGFVGGVAV
ncbi:hypothetical protein ACFS07_34715 [Undibacterium arcticum]